jgi:hypothetical protein
MGPERYGPTCNGPEFPSLSAELDVPEMHPSSND